MVLKVDTQTNDLGVGNSHAELPEQWYQNLATNRVFAFLALEDGVAAME